MDNVVESWSADIPCASTSFIIPDGCRDLICLERPSQAPQWFISPLQSSIHTAQQQPGSCLTGFRMHPGTAIQSANLLAQVKYLDPDEVASSEMLSNFTARSKNLTDALTCLARNNSIPNAARELGVGVRSLQRLVQGQTGQPPAFWRQLARIRDAGRQVGGDAPLADIAFDTGFSDQSHMNREFRRWFGVSPKVFSEYPRLMEQLDAAGYG
ncbi:MAG: helix-turn-helix domain-containing protein [Paracoccaceae bacterium]